MPCKGFPSPPSVLPMKTQNTVCPYLAETRDLLAILRKNGFEIRAGDNGEGEKFPYSPENEEGFLSELLACDEAWLFVTVPASGGEAARRASLFLVFGNSPGELVCDYTDVSPLVSAVEFHADKWSGRGNG